jgi:hypothetical protein
MNMNRLTAFRAITLTLAALAATMPAATSAAVLPSGERVHGNVSIEPAYDDYNGSIVYLLTPNHLAPLSPTNPLNNLNAHAVAPLYIIVYPPGTPGVFNCMGVPGNCPDHDGVIASVATGNVPEVYGSEPAAVPGHDHLVGLPHTGDFNFAWHVYIELFNSREAVRHITTLSQLKSAASDLTEVDSHITFGCAVVSEHNYLSGIPA